jgi:hypothetical protein
MPNPGAGVTVVKEFSYRGDAGEQWSNTYWFGAPAPITTAEWDALTNAVIAHEKTVIPANSKFVQVYGYDDRTYGSHAVYDRAITANEPGTFPPPAAAIDFAGDQAACVQWKTSRKNKRGKWIYLRKYLHDGFVDAASPDFLAPEYHAALLAYADLIQETWGGLVPGPSKEDPTPGIYDIVGTVVHSWVTTRTLKRRGKRPVPKAPAGLV